MKIVVFVLLTGALGISAQSSVDVYSAKELQAMAQQLSKKRTQFASRDLARYGNHYTLLAYREAAGSAEVHEHEADIFVIESGEATLVTGGRVMNSHTQKDGEIRGTSIEGGERHQIEAGDIVHISAGTAHQILVDKGKPFTYFVVKVAGQQAKLEGTKHVIGQ